VEFLLDDSYQGLTCSFKSHGRLVEKLILTYYSFHTVFKKAVSNGHCFRHFQSQAEVTHAGIVQIYDVKCCMASLLIIRIMDTEFHGFDIHQYCCILNRNLVFSS